MGPFTRCEGPRRLRSSPEKPVEFDARRVFLLAAFMKPP